MAFRGFRDMFRVATGHEPFPYQVRMAEAEEMPGLLVAPAGAGKTTAAVMAWIWRRRFAGREVREATPRRLVYCLPARAWGEDLRDRVAGWVSGMGLSEEGIQRPEMTSTGWKACATDGPETARARCPILVQLVGDEGDWDLFPELDAVLIGTQDMLLSRALNRGYGMSRYRWPVHFGLLNSDCLWVYDAAELMGNGLACSAQLQAFRESMGCFGPVQSLWMSSTSISDGLRTVDFRDRVDGLVEMGVSAGEKSRRDAIRQAHALTTGGPGGDSVTGTGEEHRVDGRHLARSIFEHHVPGSLSLAVVHGVDRAKSLAQDLATGGRKGRGDGPEVILLHSQYRGVERERLIQRLRAPLPPGGRIVVSTSVIEAGMDISARTLFSEADGRASVVPKIGQCTQSGAHVLRRRDLVDLFDTTSDLAGHDIDVGRFIADYGEGDVQVFWRDVEGADAGARRALGPGRHKVRPLHKTVGTHRGSAGAGRQLGPGRHEVRPLHRTVGTHRARGPRPQGGRPLWGELCAVPVGDFRRWMSERGTSCLRWDAVSGRWVKMGLQNVFPGQVILVRSTDGGYSIDMGWDENASERVVPVDVSGAIPMEANDSDELALGGWKTVADHSEEVCGVLRLMLARMPSISGDLAQELEISARWHDRGKAHEVFQKAIVRGEATPPPPSPRRTEERGSLKGGERIGNVDVPEVMPIWAKAPEFSRYERSGFRHELGSGLAMMEQHLSDLSCYLAAAHHGKVRVSIRSIPCEGPPEETGRRFARGIWEEDELPAVDLGSGVCAPGLRLSLMPMEMGMSEKGPSWVERMLRLRDDAKLGPFRIAFLEAVLRAADARASRGDEGRFEVWGILRGRDALASGGTFCPDSQAGKPVLPVGLKLRGEDDIRDMILDGCRGEPLLSYLKGLGVFRVVGEQKDLRARCAWREGRLLLKSCLDQGGLVRFFLHDYHPSPIAGPWAGGSGFFGKDDTRWVKAILSSKSPRLATYRETIQTIQGILHRENIREKPDHETKKSLLRLLRQEMSDEFVNWMDCTMAIQENGQAFAPVLGTGGNDSRLDFSRSFMERIVELGMLDHATQASERLLMSALWDEPVSGMPSGCMGQFSPGQVRGPDAGQDIQASPKTNPWDFVLMMEGILVMAGAVVRRLGASQTYQGAFPFTVRSSAVGHASLAAGEERECRGEIWLPFWTAFASLPEVLGLFSEGRAEISGHQARSGLDFGRSLGSLGVNRGLSRFARYGFLKRNGKAFLATPLGQYSVETTPQMALLNQLDSWLDQCQRVCRGGDYPGRISRALRVLENAMMDVCRRGADSGLTEVLVALGRIEREISVDKGNRSGGREGGVDPVPLLSCGWREACDDGSLEFRLAAAVGSIRSTGPVGPLRENLEPVLARFHGPRWAEGRWSCVWHRGELCDSMAEVLRWRLSRACRGGLEGIPLEASRPAPLPDIVAFLEEETDDRRLEDLIWGCALIAPGQARAEGIPHQPEEHLLPIPLPYAMLKLLFLPASLALRDGQGLPVKADPGILARLRSGDIDGAMSMAGQRLWEAGRGLRFEVGGVRRKDHFLWDIDPRRLAGALLIPMEEVGRVAGLVLSGTDVRGWGNLKFEI